MQTGVENFTMGFSNEVANSMNLSKICGGVRRNLRFIEFLAIKTFMVE
jgi:hypothetical protein